MMDQPWFRKLFYRPQRLQLENAQTKADNGDADAQFGIGLKFASGEGTALDYAQAASWYLKAANQNHALAQLNLGTMFASGQGVPQDDDQALTWILRAAQQGDAGAQYKLGLRHLRASRAGFSKNAHESRLEAYKWLQLASTQGYRSSAAAFENVALGMTREEVADGNHRAAAFVAAHPGHTPAQS